MQSGGMSDRGAALRAQLAAVSRDLSAVRQQARSERRRQGREDKRNERAWRLSEWQRHVLLIIYTLAGYNAPPASKFLASEALRRKWPPKSDEELQVIVEDAFLEVPEAKLADLCYLPEPLDPAAAKEAVRWAEEWRLAKWIEGFNDRGAAPPTGSVLERLEQQRRALPEGVRPNPRGTVAETRARMYALRFRNRWGARHQRIRPREDMEPAEMRQKVGRGSPTEKAQSCCRNPGAKSRPDSGPDY